MANEQQLAILKQGVTVWNKWREESRLIEVDLSGANLRGAWLRAADLSGVDLSRADLKDANLSDAYLGNANLREAQFYGASLRDAHFHRANLRAADLRVADLNGADLRAADLSESHLRKADLRGSIWLKAKLGHTTLADLDLSQAIGLEDVFHEGPSIISRTTYIASKGKIPDAFLRGCGLSDWEIEAVKLYNPDLSNQEINDIQYRMYDVRATQALQISPLFVSYSHGDSKFVDKIGHSLTEKGIRYWRDIHDLKAGRIEKQIDRAILQNPTLLLVLSKHSLSSDWVVHEVRTARGLEREIGRDVLCPIALDESWKDSPWPKRIMEQLMEYNILDFSEWQDHSKFDETFGKLIDGLQLFYEG